MGTSTAGRQAGSQRPTGMGSPTSGASGGGMSTRHGRGKGRPTARDETTRRAGAGVSARQPQRLESLGRGSAMAVSSAHAAKRGSC